MNIKLPTIIPPGLVPALQKQSATLDYTALKTVFHCIATDQDRYIGVAGDGGNGAYEWFMFDNGNLATSNSGYGDTLVALRDVLNRECD